MRLRLLPLILLVSWTIITSTNEAYTQCTSLDYSISFNGNFPTDDCCWDVTLENDNLIELVRGVEINNLSGAEIGMLTANGGWTTQNVSPLGGQVFPNGPFIQPGVYPDQFTICLTDRTSIPQSFDLSWIVDDPNGIPTLICTETVFLDCPLSPPPIDSCENGSYNLVFNGDFGLGDTGFGSGLGSSCTCQAATYCVTTDAKLKCNNSFWDPVMAPDLSNYLVVDGGIGTIWSQTVNVTLGEDYNFSFDHYPDISNDPEPTLELYIDNTLVLGGIVGTSGTWLNFDVDWTATFSGPALLEIRQANSVGFDDYGIDNIVFEGCCKLDVSLTDTISVCEGEPVQFHPVVTDAVGPVTYSWSPATGLNNPNIADPIATPGMNTTYTLTVTDSVGCMATASIAVNFVTCPCNDLVTNGDFEAGDTGFSSNLASNCTCTASSYCIDENARDKCTNSFWQSIDAPSGLGNYMIIDGFGSSGVVWSQTFNVVPGYVYDFCFDYYPNISGSATGPQLLVDIDDGSTLYPLLTTSGVPGSWQKYCASGWVAPAGVTSITLRIQQQTSAGFDDFGIDNIQFGSCCDLQVSHGPVDWCPGDVVQLNPTITGGTAPLTYSWSPATGLSSTTIANPMAGPQTDQTYTLTVTDADGCTATTTVALVGMSMNLVVNGNFSSGNTGFNSDLTQSCTCQAGTYCVAPNAQTKCNNSLWQPIMEPGGSGNYLVVDGSVVTQGDAIWFNTYNLTAGTSYDFCFDFYPNVSGGGVVDLQVEIEEIGTSTVTVLGSTNAFGCVGGAWCTDVCFPPFVPGAAGAYELRIVQLNGPQYSDYGIDNVAFGTCLTIDTDEVLLPEIGTLEVHPNPFTYELIVSMEQLPIQEYELTLFNISGQSVLNETAMGGDQAELDTHDLPSGAYLLVARDRFGGIWRARVIK